MNILGVSISHEANAALLSDNSIVAAVAEERFTRVKMDMNYPKNAIEYCLNSQRIDPSQLDYIVLVTEDDSPDTFMLNRIASFSVDDFIREQHEYFKPVLLDNKSVNYLSVFSDKLSKTHYDLSMFLDGKMSVAEVSKKYLEIRIDAIAKHLGVDKSIIKTVQHENAHVYYGYYANPIRDDAVILTAESSGEYSNGTVSICRSGQIKELSYTKENHIAHLYKFITLLLGMKPTQHEYKVMGLAPYANSKEVEKAYRAFRNLFTLDGLNIGLKEKPDDFYFWFQRKLEGCRFDGIAGALQKVTEEIIVKWIKHCCKQLNVSNVVFSGGVAQNIKACQVIGEIDEVEKIFVAPSTGDGSLSVGACYFVLDKIYEQSDMDKRLIKPIQNVYLGPEYSKEEIDAAINESNITNQFRVLNDIDNTYVCEQLIKEKVVARFSGRMEFGQRALGNRSILANPKNPRMIQKINSKIKFRDFWMPFTPTILKEFEDQYIINPKKLESPYMTLAFNTTELFQDKAPAAIHPADDTARPQILKKEQNSKYYDLLDLFKEMTGLGCVLNTSMNLHGEPMVCSPKDAIHTLSHSELDILVFDHVAIMKDKKDIGNL